jgi:hypothetical protein
VREDDGFHVPIDRLRRLGPAVEPDAEPDEPAVAGALVEPAIDSRRGGG